MEHSLCQRKPSALEHYLVAKKKAIGVDTFFRYLRGVAYNDDLHNMGGITYAFEIDYSYRTLHAGFSICSVEDNFNKEIGRELAFKNMNYSFDLDTFMKIADRLNGFKYAFNQYLFSSQLSCPLTERERTLIHHPYFVLNDWS